MSTKRIKTVPAVSEVRVDWKATISKLALGDRVLVHGKTQESLARAVSRFNTPTLRFVTKRHPKDGVYIIRVI